MLETLNHCQIPSWSSSNSDSGSFDSHLTHVRNLIVCKSRPNGDEDGLLAIIKCFRAARASALIDEDVALERTTSLSVQTPLIFPVSRHTCTIIYTTNTGRMLLSVRGKSKVFKVLKFKASQTDDLQAGFAWKEAACDVWTWGAHFWHL